MADLFDSILDFLGPFFMFAVGSIFAYVGYYILNKGKVAQKEWLKTPAKITSSSVFEKSERDKDAQGFSYDRILFCPLIQYEYVFNSKKHFGEFSLYSTSNPNEAESIISNYSADKEVEIFVNPKNSQESMLLINSMTFDYFPYIFLGIGIFVMLLAIVLFISFVFGVL
jgi:hypothetical protein